MVNTTQSLFIWAVYNHPSDYKDDFVARKWETTGDGEVRPLQVAIVSKDYNEIRLAMRSMGLIRIPAAGDDDPCLIETWV